MNVSTLTDARGHLVCYDVRKSKMRRSRRRVQKK